MPWLNLRLPMPGCITRHNRLQFQFGRNMSFIHSNLCFGKVISGGSTIVRVDTNPEINPWVRWVLSYVSGAFFQGCMSWGRVMVPMGEANFTLLQRRNYSINRYQILNEWWRRLDIEDCRIWQGLDSREQLPIWVKYVATNFCFSSTFFLILLLVPSTHLQTTKRNGFGCRMARKTWFGVRMCFRLSAALQSTSRSSKSLKTVPEGESQPIQKHQEMFNNFVSKRITLNIFINHKEEVRYALPELIVNFPPNHHLPDIWCICYHYATGIYR